MIAAGYHVVTWTVHVMRVSLVDRPLQAIALTRSPSLSMHTVLGLTHMPGPRLANWAHYVAHFAFSTNNLRRRWYCKSVATNLYRISCAFLVIPVARNSLPVALRSSDVTEETLEDIWRHFCLTVLTISYVDRDIDSYVTILPSLPT